MKNFSLNSFFKNPCNTYLIVCLLYSLQGTGFYNLGQLSVLLHLILVCMTAHYFVYANKTYKFPPFLKATNALMIVVIIYTFVRALFAMAGDVVIDMAGREIVPTETIRSFYPLLSVYAFYIFAREGYIDDDMLRSWVFVFVGCAILSIYGSKTSFQARAGSVMIGDFTNNMGYVMLSIIPAVVLFKRTPILQYSLLLVIDYFVFTSMKRGAMLIGVICTLFFIYQSYKLNKKHRTATFIVSAIVIVGLFYFFSLEYSTNVYFMSRVEMTREGNTSERDLIYSQLLSYFVNQSNEFELIFGHGLDGCVKSIGIMAHNDWIEYLIDFGVIGIVLLMSFFISLYKTIKKIRTVNFDMVIILGLSALLLLIRPFSSMSLTEMTYYTSILMGFALSYYNKKEYERN